MENQGLAKYQNPISYLKLFFRRKWFFITPLFVGLVLGIVAYFVSNSSYESHTLILVEEQRTINPLIQDLAVSTSAVQRLQTMREQILGWNNLVDLVKKLNLASKVQNQLEFEELIKGLRKKILVEMRGVNIINLAYKSNEPQEALLVAKTLTDSFIEENMRSVTKETDVAIEFLKEQLQVYKRKIKESEIADLEDQLNKLLLDSTAEHPLVKELQQKITSAQKEMDSGEYKVAESEKPVNTKMRETLKKELDRISGEESLPGSSAFAMNNEATQDPNTSIYKLFLMDKLDSSMARDMQVNEQVYNMLLQRLETAKITQRLEASKQGTRYTIIDPPRLPLQPTKPRIIFVFIGLFLGGGAGVGLVFAREFLDQSFLDIEDAKENLDMPVLGAISRITTQEEIRRERERKLAFAITILVASAALIIAAVLYSLLKK